MRPTTKIAIADQLPSTSSDESAPPSIRRRHRRGAVTKFVDTAATISNNKSKFGKASRSWRERKQTVATMGKLKRLVPTLPKNEEVSRFELLQHVIDYIFELQRQLNDPLTAVENREL